LQHSDRRSIFKNTGKRGSGRLVGWSEGVFGFSCLLSWLERWNVDQKRANRPAEKPFGGDCRIIRINYTVEMISFLPGNEKNTPFGKMSQPGVSNVASINHYNGAFGEIEFTGYCNLMFFAFRDRDEGREVARVIKERVNFNGTL
jgi:hypothetical protein